MPTDPFVPVPSSAAPRHKQSMPSGIAVPPASQWTTGRPGEVGPDEPSGALRGRPSPNGGFALTLARRQSDAWQLSEHEYVGDAVAVVAEIAMKRAAQFGRAPVKGDVDAAVALLGYDGSATGDWVARRAALIHEAAHHYQPRRRTVDLVDDERLRQTVAAIAAGADSFRRGLVTQH